MAEIYIGSARIGENGSIVGGKDGDQKQTSSNDMVGEVSSQRFYVHSKGWDIIRPVDVDDANKIARENKYACDNKNIGYNQNERYDVVNNAKKVKSLKDIGTPCNSDCSSLTRAEIITATGKDVGDFTTASCKDVLVKSGLFEYVGKYVSQEKTPIYDGDILCTCTKGHVVTVNGGNPRAPKNADGTTKYYPKYTGATISIVVALGAVGEKNTSMNHRKEIAKANGIKNYSGTADQNGEMLSLLKSGKLIKA